MVTWSTNEVYLTYLSSTPLVRCQVMELETLERASMFRHNCFASSDMSSLRQTSLFVHLYADVNVPIYNYKYICPREKRQGVYGPQFQSQSFYKGVLHARC